MIKSCNIFWGVQKLANAALWVKALSCNKKKSRQQNSAGRTCECASAGDPLLLYKILHVLFFPLVRNSLCLGLESQKKIINVIWIRDLWNFSFFGPGDVSPTQSEHCRFVSRSQAKHQVFSPVKLLLKTFMFASAFVIMSCQDVTRSSLCSGVKECGAKHAHNFLFPKSSFKIRRTTVLGMFKDSGIILDAIRRPFLTKSATGAMFASVRVDFGRPPFSSSSTNSLPSRNRD